MVFGEWGEDERIEGTRRRPPGCKIRTRRHFPASRSPGQPRPRCRPRARITRSKTNFNDPGQCMSAYTIFDVDIRDMTRYQEFMTGAKPAVEAAGGRYLVRGGAHKVHEGDWVPRRIVLIEFPSAAAFESFYKDAAYRRLKPIRDACSSARLVSVEGLANCATTGSRSMCDCSDAHAIWCQCQRVRCAAPGGCQQPDFSSKEGLCAR